MRTTTILLLILLLLAASASFAEEKIIRVDGLLTKLEKGQQVTIVALGDSNTELTFHTRGHLNWVYLLQSALFEKYGANRIIMIDAGCCGEGAGGGLARLDRDVLRFKPDLVIVCYWDGDMQSLKQIVEQVQASGADVLLRTPNPVVAPNMPPVTPKVAAGNEWPNSDKGMVADKIIALATELKLPVVDHYHAWMAADRAHDGPPATNPNKLWMRMSDATHPGPVGHLAFYRELAPFFGLPEKLSWEF